MLDWLKAQLKLHILRPRFKRLYDCGCAGLPANAPRTLLSYIVHPFSISPNDPRFLRHINIWRARKIVQVLNELGYIVDVVDYRDTKFVPHRKYEVFIGHGGINFERIVERLPDSATKIYFSTGCYWRFHNGQELARFAALQERRGVNLPPDRLITHSEEGALLASDGIVGIGNDFTRQTYTGFSPVIMVNNTALIDDHYEQVQKNFEAGRSHFLYYAGEGNVHKGLDLLLDAFLQLKGEHLWICTHLDQQFEEVYSEALQNRSNIHLIGWLQARSSQYYGVMNRCNWAILPSCSEGGAQSIIECMNQGLISMVSQACGLDIGDYGVMLNPCTVEDIAEIVQGLSQRSPEWCEERSRRTRKAAVTEFSETAFLQNMNDAIQAIIKRKG